VENLDTKSKGDSRRWKNWTIGFAIWTVVGISFGTRSYLYYQMNGTPAEFWDTLLNYMTDFYVWGAFSPLIFILVKRVHIERGNIFWGLAFHTFVGLLLVIVVTVITIPILWYLGFANLTIHPTLTAYFNKMALNAFYLHQGLIAYWGTVVVAHAYEYNRQVRIGRTRASELSAQLAQAQLAALKMQIHPHFLFNTLNSIAALLHEDVEMADRMITRLSDFLRITLQSSAASVVTLGEEVGFLQAYLDIERVRFRDRLIVELTIAPDVLDAQVPNLILQPLVENAVRHGISKQVAVGHLQIDARRQDERLLIQIDDNGPGRSNGNGNATSKPRTNGGVGLANTRARLKQFYGDFEFNIVDRKDRDGTTVILNVPYLVE
jgi:two-component system, LytTR family, sensor kinase